MLRESASCLVGVIAIETLPCETDARPCAASDCDATLSRLLAYLAQGDLAECDDLDEPPGEPRRIDVCRRASQRAERRVDVVDERPARVTADLGHLSSELHQALQQARRKVARSYRLLA